MPGFDDDDYYRLLLQSGQLAPGQPMPLPGAQGQPSPLGSTMTPGVQSGVPSGEMITQQPQVIRPWVGQNGRGLTINQPPLAAQNSGLGAYISNALSYINPISSAQAGESPSTPTPGTSDWWNWIKQHAPSVSIGAPQPQNILTPDWRRTASQIASGLNPGGGLTPGAIGFGAMPSIQPPQWPSRPVTRTPQPQGPPGYLNSTSATPAATSTAAPAAPMMPPRTTTPMTAYPPETVQGPPQPTMNPSATANVPAPRAPQSINLGYYAPTTGIGRGGGTFTPYTNPNDPRIYRGPGAIGPLAAAPAQIPPAATAQVPAAAPAAQPPMNLGVSSMIPGTRYAFNPNTGNVFSPLIPGTRYAFNPYTGNVFSPSWYT